MQLITTDCHSTAQMSLHGQAEFHMHRDWPFWQAGTKKLDLPRPHHAEPGLGMSTCRLAGSLRLLLEENLCLKADRAYLGDNVPCMCMQASGAKPGVKGDGVRCMIHIDSIAAGVTRPIPH